jgi:hypothetical protein
VTGAAVGVLKGKADVMVGAVVTSGATVGEGDVVALGVAVAWQAASANASRPTNHLGRGRLRPVTRWV